jgi:hypothetical protein
MFRKATGFEKPITAVELGVNTSEIKTDNAMLNIFLWLFAGLFGVSALLVIFWLSWRLHFGGVPDGYYGFSRWWDVLEQPIWVLVSFVTFLMNDEFKTGLNNRCIIGHWGIGDIALFLCSILALIGFFAGIWKGIAFGFLFFLPMLVFFAIQIIFLFTRKTIGLETKYKIGA